MSVFPQIQAMIDKVDHPERLAMIEAYGIEFFADANFFNLLKSGMLELYELFQVSQGRRFPKLIETTSYTIQGDDFNKMLLFTSNTAVTVTVPAGLDFNIYSFQQGNGQLSFVGASGVQLAAPVDSYSKSDVKGSVVGLIKTDTNKFNLIGKLQLI